MFELRKIGIVKRASAWLLDAILLAVLATGFMYIISLIAGFDHQQDLLSSYYNAWDGYREQYLGEIAGRYGFTYEVSEDGKQFTVRLQSGENADYFDVLRAMEEDPPKEDEDPALIKAYNAYLDLKLRGIDCEGNLIDEKGVPMGKLAAQNSLVTSLFFVFLSVGVLLSYLVLEFILPIILKNGQTVGKKVFAICLVRPTCVRITHLALFARTMIGKFAFETMFPILLVYMFLYGGLGILAVILLAALLLLNLILFFATKNRTPIHDLLAGTVAVDAKLQMIYYSEDELNEAIALLHREEAESRKS